MRKSGLSRYHPVISDFVDLNMKTLMLVRHAQATESVIGLADHARELTEHGRQQANTLAVRMMAGMGPPDLMLVSSAKRTLATSAILVAVFGSSSQAVQTDDGLYLASEDTLWQTVWSTDDGVQRLMIVGHNPGLSEMVQAFDPACSGLKTAQAFCVEFNVSHWHEVNPARAIVARLVA